MVWNIQEVGAGSNGQRLLLLLNGLQPVTDGVLRWLENPVYDSYALALVGQALLRADTRYLVLAAESVLLLNGLEAGVENRPFRRKRSLPLV